jgi:SAM-dependent methyltransferase
MRRLHGRRQTKGTTIDGFRLNEVVSQIAFMGRRGRVYRRIVSLSGVRPGDSVLDVGSSSGYLARKLAAAAVGGAGRVTGVDPSQAAIAYARRRARPGMTFSVGVAQDLDLPDASFDVVTCTLAMHHVPARQREAALREMYRVTRPGGRLLVADFDPSRRKFLSHPGGRRMRLAAVTVGPLEELAAQAGYRVESAGDLPLLRYVLAVRPPTGLSRAISWQPDGQVPSLLKSAVRQRSGVSLITMSSMSGFSSTQALPSWLPRYLEAISIRSAASSFSITAGPSTVTYLLGSRSS